VQQVREVVKEAEPEGAGLMKQQVGQEAEWEAEEWLPIGCY